MSTIYVMPLIIPLFSIIYMYMTKVNKAIREPDLRRGFTDIIFGSGLNLIIWFLVKGQPVHNISQHNSTSNLADKQSNILKRCQNNNSWADVNISSNKG